MISIIKITFVVLVLVLIITAIIVLLHYVAEEEIL